MKKANFVLGYISATLLTMGLVFKFQHWPGASIMLVLGGFIFSFVFLPSFIIHKMKQIKD